MKNKKSESIRNTGKRKTSTYILGAVAAAALPLSTSTVCADDAAPAPSRTHALINFELSDQYLTPRGMIVQDEGLVFQPLILGFFNLYGCDKGFLNSVTVVGGVWNCFGTGRIPSSDSGGANTTSWYEIDPIAGLSFGFAKHFTLDLTYTAFNMQILNIPFSQHLETKLSFDDSAFLKGFALHPYVIYWWELDGKAVASYSHQSSWYFDVGISPSYTFEKACGLKVEAPCRVLMPSQRFYGNDSEGGPGPSSTVALWEVGGKASIPMKFMPKGYGNWSFHVGVRYMNFEDRNLQQLAKGGGFGPRTKDDTQVYGGFTSFF